MAAMPSVRRSLLHLPASPPIACDDIGSLCALQLLIHITFVLVFVGLYTGCTSSVNDEMRRQISNDNSVSVSKDHSTVHCTAVLYSTDSPQ